MNKLYSTGNKSTTNVFASGAVIARQNRVTSGGTSTDTVGWQTADPVTGTVGTMGYYGGYVSTSTENVEPLGQMIHPNDPADYSRRLT